MGETTKKVIIDTFALMAKATGEITKTADKVLEKTRTGEIQGIIHPLIVYEFLVQYSKGRLPVFKNASDAQDFLETYFTIKNLIGKIVRVAADIKVKSRKWLRESTEFKTQSLAVCDAITISLAKNTELPIVSGDRDLTYIAKRLDINTIW